MTATSRHAWPSRAAPETGPGTRLPLRALQRRSQSGGLATLGFPNVDAAALAKLDKADPQHIELLTQVGDRAADQVKVREHFGPFVP